MQPEDRLQEHRVARPSAAVVWQEVGQVVSWQRHGANRCGIIQLAQCKQSLNPKYEPPSRVDNFTFLADINIKSLLQYNSAMILALPIPPSNPLCLTAQSQCTTRSPLLLPAVQDYCTIRGFRTLWLFIHSHLALMLVSLPHLWTRVMTHMITRLCLTCSIPLMSFPIFLPHLTPASSLHLGLKRLSPVGRPL